MLNARKKNYIFQYSINPFTNYVYSITQYYMPSPQAKQLDDYIVIMQFKLYFKLAFQIQQHIYQNYSFSQCKKFQKQLPNNLKNKIKYKKLIIVESFVIQNFTKVFFTNNFVLYTFISLFCFDLTSICFSHVKRKTYDF